MPRTDISAGGAGAHEAAISGTPSVTPLFPLLLLETLRDMDRPEEVLEGEDLSISMPRRLGLNDVVFTQIHRFREEVKRKRLQSPATVADLIRLVIRRPDADEIFEEAGRRLAAQAWNARSAAARRMTGWTPAALRLRAARKAAARVLRQVAGEGKVRIDKRPLAVHVDRPLTVQADPGGAACQVYAGILAETLTRYTGRPHAPEHPHCLGRGGSHCEWTATAVEA